MPVVQCNQASGRANGTRPTVQALIGTPMRESRSIHGRPDERPTGLGSRRAYKFGFRSTEGGCVYTAIYLCVKAVLVLYSCICPTSNKLVLVARSRGLIERELSARDEARRPERPGKDSRNRNRSRFNVTTIYYIFVVSTFL